MSSKSACVHGAKSLRVICAGLRSLPALVEDLARREGWAYVTELSGPGVRVVTHSVGGPAVGETHVALDVYEAAAGH